MAKKAQSGAHRKPATDAQKQGYDNVLKQLVEKQADSVIPLLLGQEELKVVDELTIEVLIPPRRVDRAYKTRSEDGLEVLDLEFEVKASSTIDKRLLIYHGILLEKYNLPVTSIVIYPFEKPTVTSPLVETKGSKEILRFQYQTLYLPNLDARRFMEQGAVPIYGLVPVMGHISDDLLLQAIEEMIKYCGEDKDLLRIQLKCFSVLFRRARPLPPVQFERVDRRLRMFDHLLEEDPWVKEKIAEGEARGEAKARTKAASEELVRLVRGRYPALLHLAKARITKGEPPDVLYALIEQLWAAPDEQAARRLLETDPTS